MKLTKQINRLLLSNPVIEKGTKCSVSFKHMSSFQNCKVGVIVPGLINELFKRNDTNLFNT